MAEGPPTLRKTPLHAAHVALGARMMPFGGFDMPVQYTSIVQEHRAVREAAGLFDVSHMGEVMVRGPQAFAFVQQLVTNDVARLYDGRALYTVMCRPDGGIVDDLLVYRFREDAFMLVINAANIAKDLAWMRANNPMGAELEDASEATALLALQGPAAFAIARQLTDAPIETLKFYHFTELGEHRFAGCAHTVLSYTGYTGEPGLEVYCRAEDAPTIWSTLLEAGAEHGLQPAGLGARDTLRLEAGFCLYGHDITEDTNPLEAGLGWLVKLDQGDFIGREALLRTQRERPARKLVGFVVEGRGIPRPGYALVSPEGASLGEVTSGTQSPMLRQGIGLGYVPNDPACTEPGAPIAVLIRGRRHAARVQKPPFHKRA